MGAQRREKSLQVLRQGTCEGQAFAGHRMGKRQSCGVQCGPWKAGDGIASFHFPTGGRSSAAVQRIADERVRAGSHVDAHLVRATGVDAHADKGRSVQNLGYVVHRERCATAGLAHVHALAMARVAGDGSVHHAMWRTRHAMDDGQVLLLDRAAGELPRKLAMCLIVLGHHQQAGGALVEAVHDAGTQDASDAGEIVHVVQKGVDKRAARHAGARMHDHASRLVEHEEMRVLVNDREGQVLGLGQSENRIGQVQVDALAVTYPRGRPARVSAVDLDSPVGDEGLEAGPALFRQVPRQPHIQARSRITGVHDE